LKTYTNSAIRILNVIDSARNQSQNVATAVIWSRVLGLDEAIAQNDPHAVQTELRLVREEVDLLERLMVATKFSKPLFAPYLSNVRSMVSVPNLSAGWSSYSHHAGLDTLLALRYCAEILPSEDEVNFGELQNLLDRAQDLRTELEVSDLDLGLRDFLLSQLDIIEKGIREYPIKGKRALKAALREGLADFATNEDAFKQPGGQMQKAQIKEVWGGFISTGDLNAEAKTAIAGMMKMLSHAPEMIEAVCALLPQPIGDEKI
jgi:hypothetical protein